MPQNCVLSFFAVITKTNIKIFSANKLHVCAYIQINFYLNIVSEIKEKF